MQWDVDRRRMMIKSVTKQICSKTSSEPTGFKTLKIGKILTKMSVLNSPGL